MALKILIWMTLSIVLMNMVQGTDYIHVKCESCEEDDPTSKDFKGALGTDLVVKYIVNETELVLLKLTYKTVNLTDTIIWAKDRVKHLPNNSRVGGVIAKEIPLSANEPHTLRVTLPHLTMADNGAVLEFDGRNDDLQPAVDKHTIVVEPKKKEVVTPKQVDSDVIVIGIVIGVIIVVMLILMLLLYKGVISLDGCLTLCGFGSKSTEEKPFNWEETDEKVYDAPKHQFGLNSAAPGQTEYAALGPGGGRLDKPKQKPQQSAYAQVKTEDIDYPPYEEPPSKDDYADSIIV